jgi:Tfp pilus assembly protein PilF
MFAPVWLLLSDKAIELDPLLADAHDALGMAYARDAQWEWSEKSFRRGIELDPNRSETHADFASYLLWPLGRTDEALKELRGRENGHRHEPFQPGGDFRRFGG